jgi:hypothetical protein
LLDKNDLLEDMFLNLPLLSVQILEKFCICRDLHNGIKEWDADFDLLEDLHHLSLLPEVGRCLEMLWEYGNSGLGADHEDVLVLTCLPLS